MFKLPLNPKAIELIKSCTYRHTCLDAIQPIISPEGIKLCAWCCSERTRGPKYCSKACSLSARAHFYPQKEEALFFLLVRQDFKCNDCKYDWAPLIDRLLNNGRVYDKPGDYRTMFSYWLMRRIRSKSEPGRKPEVDHTVPVYKGGQTLGLDNHSCLCYTCHKAKTKLDVSGKRIKNKIDP